MGLFPLLETDKIGDNPYISYNTEQLAKQEGFIRGYHQAEKDLELGWEDINNIKLIIEQVESDYVEQDKKFYSKYFYQEVLKRFKDFRERKK